MKRKDKATPRQWKIGLPFELVKNEWEEIFRIFSRGPRNKNVLHDVGLAYHKEDGDLIVRAVNCHDDLTKALRDLLMGDLDLPDVTIDAYQELLKKAEGL